jgi:hypothetical protein
VFCDEKRIAKWESGEVLWPCPEYRALQELTGREVESLGFLPSHRDAERQVLVALAECDGDTAAPVTFIAPRSVVKGDIGDDRPDPAGLGGELDSVISPIESRAMPHGETNSRASTTRRGPFDPPRPVRLAVIDQHVRHRRQALPDQLPSMIPAFGHKVSGGLLSDTGRRPTMPLRCLLSSGSRVRILHGAPGGFTFR